MADKYNDFIRLTKSYLREIDYYRQSVVMLKDKSEEISTKLEGISAKIPAYAETISGHSELTQVEAETSKRIELEKSLTHCLDDLNGLKRHINRLESCIDTLDGREQEMIRLYYREKMTYEELAERIGWSSRTCMRRVQDATRHIALMLFGEKSKDNILFLEDKA